MKSLKKKGMRENWDTMVNIPKMWALSHPEDTMGSPQILSLVLLSTSEQLNGRILEKMKKVT